MTGNEADARMRDLYIVTIHTSTNAKKGTHMWSESGEPSDCDCDSECCQVFQSLDPTAAGSQGARHSKLLPPWRAGSGGVA